MLDADAVTLRALSSALSSAEREGRLDEFVERLNVLDSLGTGTRSVLFTTTDGIDFVVFASATHGHAPLFAGTLVRVSDDQTNAEATCV